MGWFCSPRATDSVFFFFFNKPLFFPACEPLAPRTKGVWRGEGSPCVLGYTRAALISPFKKTNPNPISIKGLCLQRSLLPWERQPGTVSRRVLLQPGEGPVGGGSPGAGPGRPSHAAG